MFYEQTDLHSDLKLKAGAFSKYTLKQSEKPGKEVSLTLIHAHISLYLYFPKPLQ